MRYENGTRDQVTLKSWDAERKALNILSVIYLVDDISFLRKSEDGLSLHFLLCRKRVNFSMYTGLLVEPLDRQK